MASNNDILFHIDRKSGQPHATSIDILNSHPPLMQSQFIVPDPLNRKSSYDSSNASTHSTQFEDPQEVPEDSLTYLKMQEINRNTDDWLSPISSLDLTPNPRINDKDEHEKLNVNMNINMNILPTMNNDSSHSHHSNQSIPSSMSSSTVSMDVNSSYVLHPFLLYLYMSIFLVFFPCLFHEN